MIIALVPKLSSISLRALKQVQHKLREAIHLFNYRKGDCFVTFIPRNDNNLILLIRYSGRNIIPANIHSFAVR
jgi:hypothetical protein